MIKIKNNTKLKQNPADAKSNCRVNIEKVIAFSGTMK